MLGIDDRTVRRDLRQALETIAARTSLLESSPFCLGPLTDNLLD